MNRRAYGARRWLLLLPLLVAIVWLLRVAFAAIAPPPGGPILVVTSSQSTYGGYYAEILRAEGLNQFDVADISNLSSALPGHDVVVLANMTLTTDQVNTLTSFVTGGGNLIAMAPDAQLAGLLGLTSSGTTLSNGYLLVDTSTTAGNGIVNQTMQFHGTAKNFVLNGASSIAKLYSSATSATTNPAVTLRSVGAGQAAAFAYDLATSIVYTRQGNPAWAAQERDGFTPIRSDDKFFGAASGDVQPDWVDLTKVAIPQADEQQRLFANLILTMNAAKKPLPRFWYFPNGKKAVVIMSGDDHGNGGTAGRFDQFNATSPANCNVANWECVRGTSYVYPGTPLTNAQAATYVSEGFEVGLHITTDCTDFTASSLETTYQQQLAAWSQQYTSLPSPITMRHHCIVWSDWVTAAKTELAHGIRLDVSYYFWPPGWVNNVPGLFTGSAMPMRLADLDGTLIDVYEGTTQMTDESGQTYPFTVDTLLDRALGPEGYYGVYTVNAHTDTATSDVANAVVASAQSRNVPIVSSAQMLTWLDARNNSSFGSIGWNNGVLSFSINADAKANGLQAMLPRQSSAGPISSVTRNGTAVALTYTTVKGIQYVTFPAASGSYVATYAPDTTPPTVATTSPAGGASSVSVFTTVTATFSEPIDPSTIQASTFGLVDASNAAVPATMSYDASTLTATLTPTNALTGTSSYRATVKGGATGVKDTSGNPMASDFSWSFTTGSGPNCPCVAFSPSATPQTASTADSSSVEVGVKFQSDVPGTITGIRFYKGTGNTGTHIGNLWTLGGQLLATATFTNETASGWQQVNFATPVAIAAHTVYVASYFAPAGNYASDGFYFANTGVDNPPLHLLKDGVSGGDGVYAYGAGSSFPTSTFQSTNYWVDIVFTTNGADTTPPTVTAKSPSDGATVSPSTTVTATFSEAIDPSSLTPSTFFLMGTGGNVAATLSYNSATSTAMLTPNAALVAGATYTATIVGGSGGVKDLAGNALASNVTWGFTTSATACPCTIWPASAAPGTSSANDSAAVNVGVKFTSDVNGYITGIRFYKGSGNTGTHVGTLWSSAGQQLATATFANESTSGWQQVNFASPVAIVANTVYVASYFAPAGHYAGDAGFFARAGVDSPPLHALKDGGVGGANGVYTYAATSAFPTSTFQSTNYWVDVVFSTTATDTTPPMVASTSPASNATGVSTTTTVTATFSEAIDPATIGTNTFTLAPSGGAPVAASVSYNTANATATLTPNSALTLGATYTATITTGVKDLAGNALSSNFSWSFTTGAGACAAPANPIVAENCLTGNPSSEWDVSGAGDTTIQGFATDISVNHGAPISFKIATDATSYRLDIYRMGYYGGMGARKVATVNPSASLPQNQPPCTTDSTTGLIDCGNWGVSASWTVPSNAVSGIYFARAVRSDTGGASHIFFIVRDDASTSALFFQTSDTTWQAYNDYGGNSLYTGGPGTNPSRAYKVSYNRPFNTRTVDSGQDWVFNAEYPMVRWLEANGYDVSYTTGVDTDRNGSLIKQHKVFMSVGHDEYWSAGQRANVEAARTSGINLAFFSGNEIFWKTRWENSIDGSNTSYRTLVSYKETHANARIDPLDVSPTWTWTGTWRDPRFSPPSDGGRPENSVTGTIFMVNDGATTSITVPAADGKMRFWRNTSIATATGTTTLPNGTLGYEWDADLDNGFRPAGAFRLSTTTSTNNQVLQDYGSTFGSGTVTHALTLYRHASGALVFGAGTVQWSWGLDANHDRSGTAVDVRMQQATVNLFADMNVQPATLQSGLVTATASTDGTPPASVITSPAAGATVTPGTTVTITGTANDTGGGVVGGVEVSVDGGATWHPANGRASWTYAWTTPPSGTVTIKSRAVDDSGNIETPGAGITVTSGSASGSQVLVGDSNLEPTTDNNSAGLAEAFQYTATASGTGTTLHVYLDTNNASTKVLVGLYSNTTSNTPGTLIAQATIAAPVDGAWNTVAIPSTAISIGVKYWIAVLSPTGSGRLTFRDTTGTGISQTSSQSNLAALPTTWSAGKTFTTGPMSAYVTQDVDTTPPTVTAVSPASGATAVATTTVVSATFSEAMNAATITGTTFFLTPNGSTTPVAATVSYNTTTFVATLTPSSALAGNTTYNVTVKGGASGVKDVAGNALAADRTWSFTTAAPDTTPPTITARLPASGATGVATNTTVAATFSEAMAASTVTAQTFFVTANGSTTPVTATLSYNTTTFVATLTPGAPLAINTTYQVTVKGGAGGVTDAAGNPLAADDTWSFTTAGDTTPPTVTATTPANGATGVATGSAVTATFSEAVDATTVNGTTFRLAAGTNAVAATVSYNSTTFVATLTPSAPLSSGTTYTATISGVKDLAGNTLAGNFTWSFTTAANVLVGLSTLQPSADTNKAGTAEAFLYTASVSGTPAAMHLYVDSSNTATKIVVGLYSHNGTANAPAALLGQTTISAPTSGWNVVPLSATAAVSSGVQYWIAVLNPSGGTGTIRFRDGNSGGRSQTSSQTTLTTLPQTWPAGKSFNTGQMSAYASP